MYHIVFKINNIEYFFEKIIKSSERIIHYSDEKGIVFNISYEKIPPLLDNTIGDFGKYDSFYYYYIFIEYRLWKRGIVLFHGFDIAYQSIEKNYTELEKWWKQSIELQLLHNINLNNLNNIIHLLTILFKLNYQMSGFILLYFHFNGNHNKIEELYMNLHNQYYKYSNNLDDLWWNEKWNNKTHDLVIKRKYKDRKYYYRILYADNQYLDCFDTKVFTIKDSNELPLLFPDKFDGTNLYYFDTYIQNYIWKRDYKNSLYSYDSMYATIEINLNMLKIWWEQSKIILKTTYDLDDHDNIKDLTKESIKEKLYISSFIVLYFHFNGNERKIESKYQKYIENTTSDD